MKKSIILISVLAMMSVNSVLGAVKAVPIQGTIFDTNNSQETKNANVSLKILDASMSEYNSIRVKAVLEDKSNPDQYKEFKFTASYGGVNLESFQILENNEWKNLDSYPIDRFGPPTGTQALVDMYCEYNSDLIFYLPKYIAGNPSRELPNPLSGHFKLKYCGYEAEFDIKDNTLSKDNNNLLDANLNSMSADEINELGKKYYYGEGAPQNYDLARQYFELSAAKGSAKALYNIGSMIWYGYSAGTKEQARQYFEMAGDNGFSEGYYAIGWNILMGKLEGTNEEGRQYLERAATLGNEKAKQILK